MSLFYSATILGIVVFIGIGTVLKNLNPDLDFQKLATQNKEAGNLKQRNLGFGQDTLRVAVFGSGNAWGSGLEKRFDAYPYLLSPTVTNLAHPSAGPNYFSVCTETAIGDDAMFDVIIIDYWLRYFEGVEELARRLRQRYPHAIMIFVRAWLPVHFKRKECEHGCNDVQSLQQWKDARGLHDAHLQTVIRALENDTGYWYLPTHQHADASILSISRSVGGHEFSFTQRETGVQTLVDFMGYYDEKNHAHVSELGHQAIANALDAIIHRQVAAGQEVELVNTGVHGHWGRGDSCHVWYNSGGTNLIYSESLNMVQYDEHNGHFALEVEGTGWFVTNNKLEDNALPTRTLYISYLTSQVADDYPDADMSFEGGSQKLSTLNEVDKHHDIRTVAVGKVPFGETNVTITSIGSGRYPFRLVGVVYSNEIAVPLEWGFGAPQR